jgi:hypothetical protein
VVNREAAQRLAAMGMLRAARELYARAQEIARERGMTEVDVFYCQCGYFGNRAMHCSAEGGNCYQIARRIT